MWRCKRNVQWSEIRGIFISLTRDRQNFFLSRLHGTHLRVSYEYRECNFRLCHIIHDSSYFFELSRHHLTLLNFGYGSPIIWFVPKIEMCRNDVRNFVSLSFLLLFLLFLPPPLSLSSPSLLVWSVTSCRNASRLRLNSSRFYSTRFLTVATELACGVPRASSKGIANTSRNRIRRMYIITTYERKEKSHLLEA